ncbi:hypothetical protein [Herbaspirillum chlorophenolicum]|jgi:filamentous hemagglutinin|uniref:hypothetical protein n=1 Tax=Herbaspirillum chlorophenolicum TaxID=211589 RepID=UPI00067B7EC1|nr:hypothetical protein [Herbaspirillum chlorophenolicum]
MCIAMDCYVTANGTRVFFQNGMDNHVPDAKASAALLSGLLKEPVGAIINDSHGVPSDVKEYLPNMFATKDILNEYTYRELNAKGTPTLIVMHSAGNEDAYKALKAGQVYGYTYPNLSFLSVGSPVSAEKLQSVMRQSGSTFLGQVNDWKDPVTYSKTAVGVVGGTLIGGAALGAWYGGVVGAAAGAPAGSLGIFFLGAAGAGFGASFGASLGVTAFMGLKNYHPFSQYFQNQQLQQQALNWQQQQSSDLKK